MKLHLYFLFILLPYIVSSQVKTKVFIHFDNVLAVDAISTIEQAFDVKISYANKLIDGKTVFLEPKERSLNECLDELSSLLNVHFKIINNRYIVVNKAEEETFNYQQLNTVVINEYLTKGISKNIDATYSLQPKKLDILPGLIEADVLVSLQELPGVISPNETATGLNVRGGTPDQNHIIWDGITMYHSGHLFGMISSFNPNITQSITFYNKGTNPRFGERISSVVDITTNSKVNKTTHVGFGFNGISADGYIETPIIKEKLSILLAYRKSYENLFETRTFKQMEQKVFQNSSILDNETSEENFRFKDYNIKVNYNINNSNELSASLIHIDNDLKHNFQDFNTNQFFQDYIDTENNGYSLKWNKNWPHYISQTTTLSFSKYKLNYDFATSDNQTLLSKFDKENQIKDLNFSTEVSIPNSTKNTLNIGYQTTLKQVRYAFVETTNSSIVLDQKDSKLTTQAFFTNYSNRALKFLHFDLGLRANYYQQIDALRLEPRLLVMKNLNDHLKIQASGEIKNQAIYQIEETVYSDLSLENKLWRLSDGKESPIINSNHISIGALYNNTGWSFDFDAYYKKIKGISSLSLGFYSDNDKKYFLGHQNIYGLDFYTKKDFNNIKTWISYSINQVDNQFDGINNNHYFTSSNEIAHAVSASITYKTKKLQVALGWKWHTGKPYTLSSISANDEDINLIGVNTKRLPNYHRLDISSVYNFSFSKQSEVKGKIGLSIWNLYNQKNHLSREFTGNNIADDPIMIQDYYSLHLTPNFLFRVYW